MSNEGKILLFLPADVVDEMKRVNPQKVANILFVKRNVNRDMRVWACNISPWGNRNQLVIFFTLVKALCFTAFRARFFLEKKMKSIIFTDQAEKKCRILTNCGQKREIFL